MVVLFLSHRLLIIYVRPCPNMTKAPASDEIPSNSIRKQALDHAFTAALSQYSQTGSVPVSSEIYGSDRAVSLLCDINLCNSLHVAVLVIIVITIDEHYHIGILLDRS